MEYYFFGDDFLVLGDVSSRSFRDYMRDVIVLRDLTPNWRPLTMLVYYGEYQLFGLDALPWRIVNLTFHIATMVVLYIFVLSVTKRLFVALAAAADFRRVGVGRAHGHVHHGVPARVQRVPADVVAAGDALLREGGERRPAWYWLSLLFVHRRVPGERGRRRAGRGDGRCTTRCRLAVASGATCSTSR